MSRSHSAHSGSASDDALGGLLYTFTFDALNRAETTTAHYIPGGNRVLTAEYDAFGNRTQLDAAGASDPFTSIWRFNDLDQMYQAVLPSGADPTLSLTYWASDDLRNVTHGNGVTSDYRYDDTGPVDSIVVKDSSAAELHKLIYTPDSLLNVDEIAEFLNTTELTQQGGETPAWNYVYDAQQRLDSATYPDTLGLPTAEQDFGYDDAGNRVDPPTSSLWSYDANNRLEVSPDDPVLCWDDDGNLATKRTGPDCTSGTVTETFTYDTSNRLTQWDGAVTATYAYDPFGRRIEKAVSGVTTHYLWDGDQLLAEYNASGLRTRRYAYAGGFAPVQMADGAPGAETIFDVHSDHLDTPRLLTDSGESIAWRSALQAFGEAGVSDPSTLMFNIRFPGQYYDDETGLHYNRFRYYDAEVGRYVSADPIGQLGGINVFMYALANPVALIDPFGLNDCGAFVRALVDSFFFAAGPGALGEDFLARRNTTLSGTSGFRSELIAGGQGGQVARHVYGHAGARLRYPYGPGAAASYANQAFDYFQRFQTGRTVEQSQAEIADDRAARRIGDELRDAFERRAEIEASAAEAGGCPYFGGLENSLNDTLREILCN